MDLLKAKGDFLSILDTFSSLSYYIRMKLSKLDTK